MEVIVGPILWLQSFSWASFNFFGAKIKHNVIFCGRHLLDLGMALFSQVWAKLQLAYPALKNPNLITPPHLKNLLYDCWLLLQLQWRVAVRHVYRETNGYADGLVVEGANQEQWEIFYGTYLTFLLTTFSWDGMGVLPTQGQSDLVNIVFFCFDWFVPPYFNMLLHAFIVQPQIVEYEFQLRNARQSRQAVHFYVWCLLCIPFFSGCEDSFYTVDTEKCLFEMNLPGGGYASIMAYVS